MLRIHLAGLEQESGRSPGCDVAAWWLVSSHEDVKGL